MTSALVSAVTAHVESLGGGQGLFPTHVPGVNILRSFEPRMPVRQIYRPSICLVLQGAKQILFGQDTLNYGVMEFLVVTMDLPASGRILKAGPSEPFMGITIDLDVATLREVLAQLEPERGAIPNGGPCAFVGQVNDDLSDAVQRLVRLSDLPKAIPILYPALMREICFWLLTGPHGGELRRLALPDSNSDKVARAIQLLHQSFALPLRVEQLAEVANMSLSSFHQHFKTLTSMSPLQFQKQLRLLEGRRLMVAETASVSRAAHQVGYESASQFSREYSRMFGAAPKCDATNQQRLYQTYAGRQLQPE